MSQVSFIRAELHNHSTESDGKLSIGELVSYAEEHSFEVLAITDHNTVSGQDKAVSAAKGKDLDILPGVEITTFYGHILVLGLRRMVDIAYLDPSKPEELVRELKAAGARAVGCAHPFCIGQPIMKGCRLAMKFRYPEVLDYIEVFNTSAGDLFSGNEFALNWWEQLVLQGIRIAAVTGIDLHTIPQNQDVFTTYAVVKDDAKISMQSKAQTVLNCIFDRKTMVSKGPLFSCEYSEGRIHVVFATPVREGMLLQIRQSTGTQNVIPLENSAELTLDADIGMRSAVVKLYDTEADFAHLLAVGTPIYAEGCREEA